MARFDLNQPIIWEEEEIVEEYDDGTVEDLISYGLECGESDQDREEHVDVDFAGYGGAGSHAVGYAAGGGGGVALDAHGKGGGLDLNLIANRKRRTQYTDDERRAVYSMLLKRNGGSTKMKRGVSKAVAAEMRVPVRVVQRIWLVGRRGGGIDAVVSKRAKNCGRKRIELDPDALRELTMDRGLTIQELADALRMKKTTVFRRLKEGRLRRPKK